MLANPGGDKRVPLFQAMLAKAQLPPAEILPWEDFLSGKIQLEDVLQPGDVFRIDSPGRHFEVERAMLMRGAGIAEPEKDAAYARLSPSEIQALSFDKGLILPNRQWYLGFKDALQDIRDTIQSTPNLTLMNTPREIWEMFDKRFCHRLMKDAGIRVPRGLPPIHSFDHLLAEMKKNGIPSVFIKLAHGSSAAGTVAFQKAGPRMRAITTAEVVENGQEVRLYASRKIRTLFDAAKIEKLINALCRHRVHVEHWLPKASQDGSLFDLRVIVIGQKVERIVMRCSQSPMTNLHLLNSSSDHLKLRMAMSKAQWQSAMATCLAAKACFPESLYAGVDLLIEPNFHHAVLEINAFGDLIIKNPVESMNPFFKEIIYLKKTLGQS
jgi:hypothetical protein